VWSYSPAVVDKALQSASPATVTAAGRDGWAWRVVQALIAAAALLLLSPLLAIIALAIVLEDGGAVFFIQRRIGHHGRSFSIVKFRTMRAVTGSPVATEPLLQLADDPRSSGVGRVLRRSHLDELPQLVNVLLGHMSLVGPRPLVPAEDALVTQEWSARHEHRPGLTGAWQLHRSPQSSVAELIGLDQGYLAEWSLWRDLRLITITACRVLPPRWAGLQRRAGRRLDVVQ
jgi:lipopolysaccharide/colanic/teichoic acid biosynthesis glycosyltransferase